MAVDGRFGRADRVTLAVGDANVSNEPTLGEFAGDAAVLKGNDIIRRIRNMKIMASQRTDLWF